MAALSGEGDGGLSHDAFLGGRVRAWQPQAGYRAGIDAVLMAAAVPAAPGEDVLELGCGVGVAALCLAARVPEVRLTGVEVQPAYAALAVRNAREARSAMDVATADLRALPPKVRTRSYAHVMMNPPYFRAGDGSPAPDEGRAVARAETAALADWVACAVRRLAPGGVLTIIQRVERLPELLSALDRRLGAVEALPLAPRLGSAATLVILRARKGRRSPFSLRPPLIVHRGVRHDDADDGYTAAVEAALRHGQALAGFADPGAW